MASVRAENIAAPCVNSSSVRFGTRSARAPAGNDSSSTGSDCAAATMPSQKGESVSRLTSQPWAVDCIQTPAIEISCAKNSRR